MPGRHFPPLPKFNQYSSDGADIHTAAVDVSTVQSYISKIRVNNTTAGAVSFTLTDKKTGATNVRYPTVSIAANSIAHENFSEGNELFADEGFDIQAGVTGLEVVIHYYTRP